MNLKVIIKNHWQQSYWLLLLLVLFIIYLFAAHFYIYYRIRIAGLKPVEIMQTYNINYPTATTTSLVYAALGDSLTAGVGTDNYSQSYPYLLAQKFAARDQQNYILKNFSYPGARTADLIRDMLSPTIAAKPDLVTLLIGTNDVHGNVNAAIFKKNYQLILDRLTVETEAKIYLISIPFIGSEGLLLPPYDYYFSQKVLEHNQIIQDLAATYNLTYLDLATPTRAESRRAGPHYAADLFHPSALGYQEWAEIIYDRINQ